MSGLGLASQTDLVPAIDLALVPVLVLLVIILGLLVLVIFCSSCWSSSCCLCCSSCCFCFWCSFYLLLLLFLFLFLFLLLFLFMFLLLSYGVAGIDPASCRSLRLCVIHYSTGREGLPPQCSFSIRFRLSLVFGAHPVLSQSSSEWSSLKVSSQFDLVSPFFGILLSLVGKNTIGTPHLPSWDIKSSLHWLYYISRVHTDNMCHSFWSSRSDSVPPFLEQDKWKEGEMSVHQPHSRVIRSPNIMCDQTRRALQISLMHNKYPFARVVIPPEWL